MLSDDDDDDDDDGIKAVSKSATSPAAASVVKVFEGVLECARGCVLDRGGKGA